MLCRMQLEAALGAAKAVEVASFKRQLADLEGLQAGKQALMTAQNQVRDLYVTVSCACAAGTVDRSALFMRRL